MNSPITIIRNSVAGDSDARVRMVPERVPRRFSASHATSHFLVPFALTLLFPLLTTADVPTRRILIITSHDLNRPAVSILTRAMSSVIRDGSPGRVEFLYEFQENTRIPNEKYEVEMVSYFRRKYEGENISLIVAIGAPALKFALKYESALFKGIPKLFYFHDEREETARSRWPHVTGVWATLDLTKTLDVALALHPDTQKVVVVSGNSDHDRFLREEAQRDFRKYESKAEFTYLTDLTMEELKNKLGALPNKSVVIYLSLQLDSAGNSYSGPEALAMFAPVSTAPVYGISETYMGSGIVGGSLVDFEALGKRTGELGLRLLAGERAQDITPQTMPNVTVFDWRQLRRWGLNESKLPPGSVVRFRVPRFWEVNERYVIAIIAACIIEALLIGGLLFMRARRRQAEKESERLESLAQAEHKRLNEVVSNVPGVVWESRAGSNGKPRTTTFVSENVESMLGYSVKEWLSTPEFGLKLVHEEDRERVTRESEAMFANKRGGILQFRWVAKDGRVVWVEAHMVPIMDESGKAVGMRGVTMDITDQRLAEFAKRQSEDRNRAILEAIPDLMFLQTRDGVYLDYNANNPRDLLLRPEEFIGRNMRDVLSPELAEDFSRCFERAVETREPQILEYMLTINETERCFEARVVSKGDEILSVIRDVTSRKFTEEALNRNEAQLAGIIESAMDGIITVDDSQHILLFNAAAEKIFGYSSAEVMGQPLDRLIPERFRQAHREHIQVFGEKSVTRRSMGLRGELYGLRDSGEEFPIEASISQIEISGQKLYTVILRDITERKRAEEEIKASEANYRAVFNAASDAIFCHDMETGSIIDVNQRMCEMYGFTVEEARRLNISDLSSNQPAFTQQEAMKWIERAAAGEPQLFEWLAKDKAGHLFWVEVNLRRASLGGRDVLLAVVRDITERKRALDELRKSEERFAKAFRANPQPMSITTLAGGLYLDVNQSFLTMSGYTREEVVGHNSNELKVWEMVGVREEFVRQVRNNGSVVNQETKFRTKGGSLRVLLSSAEPLEIAGEECLLVASSDITDRKEAEVALQKALEELNLLKNQLEAENIYLHQELQLDQTFGEIIGQSDAIKYVLFKISQVAPTDSTVLITGETGTGKELVARAIHSSSSRKDRPLIKVNCAALSPSLIESELFGHEKGAFTGAGARKLGRFELADGGSIFLDEIGELPLELQVKLLRVIQESELERLGGTKTIKVDVRIIAATNRDLKLEVEKGAFREDLWYRLNVFPITVPPLRQRKEDVPLMVEYFVGKYARKFGKTITSISPHTMQSLQAHSWPGNVRELANVIERAVIHTQGSVLHLADRFEQTPEEVPAPAKSLEEIEREYITRTLESTGWRIEGKYGAAKILGLNPSTLRTRMAKLGIQRRRASFV